MNPNLPSQRRSSFERTIASISVVLIALLATSCVSVNRLREAQDAFNQAAAAENALRLDSTQPLEGNGSDAAASWSLARSGYASALLSLSKLEPKDQQSLQHDGLWGTALTLKAMCQWRLAQYQKALDSADEALKTVNDQVYPRDRAVLAALPGLIKTDQAYLKILSNAPLADVEDLLIDPKGAIANLQSARANADKDQPVQIYLVQAQLAAYRNFQVAMDRLNNHATVPTDHPARVAANLQLKELKRLIEAQKPGQPGKDLVEYWRNLCALDTP